MRSSIVVIAMLSILGTPLCASELSYREAALEAAKWIRTSAINSDHGTVWPSDPNDPKSANNSLYAGTPGVVLFFLEASHSGDPSFLKEARSGADQLVAALNTEKEAGLYTGVAGIGFALIEAFKITGDSRYREGGFQCISWLERHAQTVGRGVEWNDTTDIISGGTGIGLFLLYAARELNQPSYRILATKAGERLLELGRKENVGIKWAMSPTFARLMPNFSHGTAGIAYFLATLYQETARKEFLDAALAGAKYLQSIARTEGEACLIFHNEPEGKDLYYLGWCHGPVGTARLFYRLFQITRDRSWMDWARKSARAVLSSGIPEKQTPGFWNNVSQCCGSAGVAEFFLNLYKATHDTQYLDFAKRVTKQLLAKATRDSSGMRWIQAEHRVKPDLLIAQTGYMQGASGIGMLLLHLDEFQRGKSPAISFVDSPFN
jgi:lantibiotic modifying enzyme